MSIQNSTFCYNDSTIPVLEHNEEFFLPLRPIIEKLGLSWSCQSKKLSSNPRWKAVVLLVPTAGGFQKSLCIPARKLPAFIASLTPSKMSNQIREKVDRFVLESDKADAEKLSDDDNKVVSEKRIGPDAFISIDKNEYIDLLRWKVLGLEQNFSAPHKARDRSSGEVEIIEKTKSGIKNILNALDISLEPVEFIGREDA